MPIAIPDRIDRYPDNLLGVIKSKVMMLLMAHKILANPPTEFPKLVSPEPSLPIRLDPQSPILKALYKVYDEKEHPILDHKIKSEDVDESHSKDAMQILEQHIQDRAQFVNLANERLQQALGTRNERTFDLPMVSRNNLTPHMSRLGSITESGSAHGGSLDAGSSALAAARGNILDSLSAGDPIFSMFSRESYLETMVDKFTGVGLREFLLCHGIEAGMRTIECDSITICDFTPDMRAGQHKNVMLGHWTAQFGETIEVCEVDLPSTTIDKDKRGELPTTETWIWFLISRPVVSLSATDTSTTIRESAVSPSLSSSSSTSFHTPYSNFDVLPIPSQPSVCPAAPPNFPQPTPSSFVVFACPLANVTTYPETVENLDNSERDTGEEERGEKGPFVPPKATCKRIDYDLSHCGIPIFQFSSGNRFNATPSSQSDNERIEFLSVEGIGGWDERDEFGSYDPEEYNDILQGKTGSWVGEKDEHGEHMNMDMPCPNKGVWWNRFYEKMYEDCRKWEKVRTAMGRGKCRVVVRWLEIEKDEEDSDMDSGGSEAIGLGLSPLDELGEELEGRDL